jgi:hypothetical protein
MTLVVMVVLFVLRRYCEKWEGGENERSGVLARKQVGRMMLKKHARKVLIF